MADLTFREWLLFCIAQASTIGDTFDAPAAKMMLNILERYDSRSGAAWSCAARRQGSAGGNDPADCDWPCCGCDPYATKVIDALVEGGLARTQPLEGQSQ